MADCPHKCTCTSDDECPHECTCVCAHPRTTKVIEELGPMVAQETTRGLEVCARIIGWSVVCDDCGEVVSTHGTSRKDPA